MTVSVRYRSGHRSQLHLIGTLRDYLFAMMEPMQDLYPLAIAATGMYLTLHILLGTYLHIYIIEPLLLHECTQGNRHDTLLGLCEQIDLGICPGNEVAHIIHLEGDRNERPYRSTPIGQEAPIQFIGLYRRLV